MRTTAPVLPLLALATAAAAQPCQPDWLPLDPAAPPGIPSAITSFDPDGPGPLPTRLVRVGLAGGALLTIFDGAGWALAGESSGLARVAAQLDPDGPGPLGPRLIVGGTFQEIDAAPIRYLAAFDGAAWSPVGAPLELGSYIHDLLVFDFDGPGPGHPQLVVSGSLRGITSEPVAAATWNGSAWVPLGGRAFLHTNVLTTLDPDGPGPLPEQLFLAGSAIQTPSGPSNVARWAGSNWEPIAPFPVTPERIGPFDPDGPGPLPPLLVGVGGFPNSVVATWDGSAWTAITAGLGGIVGDLLVVDLDGPGPGAERLLIAGDFTLPGNIPARVAVWNGAAWDALALPPGAVNTWGAADPDGPGPLPRSLYVAGDIPGQIARYGCPPPPPPTCPADWNGDAAVNSTDISAFLSAWLASIQQGDLAADFNADHQVNSTDISAFLTSWLDAVQSGC